MTGRRSMRPIRYALTQAEFIVMGSALSVLVALVSVVLTIILFGAWR